jgi:hypothetical protein
MEILFAKSDVRLETENNTAVICRCLTGGNATEKAVIGTKRGEEKLRLTGLFMLRR